MKPASCCCCGQPLPIRAPFRWGRARQLYEFVSSRPQGTTLEEMFNHLWGDDPDGGPLDWRKLVHTHLSHINMKLRDLDLIVARQIKIANQPYNLRRISTGNIWLPLWRERE